MATWWPAMRARKKGFPTLTPPLPHVLSTIEPQIEDGLHIYIYIYIYVHIYFQLKKQKSRVPSGGEIFKPILLKIENNK